MQGRDSQVSTFEVPGVETPTSYRDASVMHSFACVGYRAGAFSLPALFEAEFRRPLVLEGASSRYWRSSAHVHSTTDTVMETVIS